MTPSPVNWLMVPSYLWISSIKILKQPELDVNSQQETRSFTIEAASGEKFTIEERIDALINIKRLMFFSATLWQKLSSYFYAFA